MRKRRYYDLLRNKHIHCGVYKAEEVIRLRMIGASTRSLSVYSPHNCNERRRYAVYSEFMNFWCSFHPFLRPNKINGNDFTKVWNSCGCLLSFHIPIHFLSWIICFPMINEAINQAPMIRKLHLDFWSSDLGNTCNTAFRSLQRLKHLEELIGWLNDFSIETIKPYINHPQKTLVLWQNRIRAAGLRVFSFLAISPSLRFVNINLSKNRIDAEGARILSRVRFAPNLERVSYELCPLRYGQKKNISFLTNPKSI